MCFFFFLLIWKRSILFWLLFSDYPRNFSEGLLLAHFFSLFLKIYWLYSQKSFSNWIYNSRLTFSHSTNDSAPLVVVEKSTVCLILDHFNVICLFSRATSNCCCCRRCMFSLWTEWLLLGRSHWAILSCRLIFFVLFIISRKFSTTTSSNTSLNSMKLGLAFFGVGKYAPHLA